MGAGFFECGITDWIVMAMISGTGLVVILILLTLVALFGVHIGAKLQHFWPDVM